MYLSYLVVIVKTFSKHILMLNHVKSCSIVSLQLYFSTIVPSSGDLMKVLTIYEMSNDKAQTMGHNNVMIDVWNNIYNILKYVFFEKFCGGSENMNTQRCWQINRQADMSSVGNDGLSPQ